MSKYCQVLEFFMENNILLNENQMKELRIICNEASDEQVYQFLKNPEALKKFDNDFRKELNTAGNIKKDMVQHISNQMKIATNLVRKDNIEEADAIKKTIDSEIKSTGIKDGVKKYLDDQYNKAVEEGEKRKELKQIEKK